MTIEQILDKPIVMLTGADLMLLLDTSKREIIAQLKKEPEGGFKLPERPTRQDAAKFWNVSLPTVDGWVRDGKLKKIKNGRGTRFLKQDVESLFL